MNTEQLVLSSQEGETPAKLEQQSWGFRERIAAEKLGNPPNLMFYKWEAVGDFKRMDGPRDAILTGAIVTRLYATGPRKGRPDFRGTALKVVVAEREIDAAKAKYRAETGLCSECEGSGRQFAGWSVTDGTRYRTCSTCKGDTKAR